MGPEMFSTQINFSSRTRRWALLLPWQRLGPQSLRVARAEGRGQEGVWSLEASPRGRITGGRFPPWQVRGRTLTHSVGTLDRPLLRGAATLVPLSGWLAEVPTVKGIQKVPGLSSPLRKEKGSDSSQQEPLKSQPRRESEHSRTGGGEEEREMAGRNWKGSWGS